MTRAELLGLLRRLTARCWCCGIELPRSRRRDRRFCGPRCRKAIERQWEAQQLKRDRTRFPKSEIGTLAP